MNDNLTKALRLSALGYKVYAAYGIKDLICLCGNMPGCRPGKHPYGAVCPHGTKDATTDAAKLKEWFRGPLANVGVAVDGFCVLDVERRGMPLLERWEAAYGPLPKTPTVRSGSGGRHYWFKPSPLIKPQGTGIKWVDGAEILTTGGVIVPPSNHVSGGRYEWIHGPETPLADMPDWLVSQVADFLTAEAKKKSAAATAFDFGNMTVDTGLTFATLGRLPSGNRNEPVNRVIGSMLRHGYSPTQIMEAGGRWAEEQEPPYCLKELNSKIADFARKEAVKVAEVRFEDAGDELTDTRSPLSALTGSAFGSSAASTAEENDDNTTPVEPENGLPEAAYYGLIGEYLKAVAPLTEADPAGILACVLTGVGSALGRRVHHRTGRRHSGNLFTLLIGSTASRKGTCWSVASELLTQADPDWMAACVEGGFGSGEGLVHRIRDASEKDTGVPDKRLLVVEEEFAKPLRLCRSEKSTLSPLIRYAFDGSPLTIMNRGENRYGCREPHVGVIGMTTADELRELLKGRSELANGTLNRFLMIGCRRAGYLPLGGDYWRIAEDFGPELRAVLAAATDKPLTLDSAAAELWSSEYRRLEAEREGDYGKAVARLSVHALKVALIYAVVDGSTVIGLLHLKAALALIDYADRSAEGVFARNPNPSYGGEPLGGGEPSHAKLLAFVKSRGAEGITKREAHKLFNGHRKAEGLNADFATLVAVGLIVEACGRWYATEYRPTGCCGDTDDTDTGEHESGERQPAPPDTGSPDTALRSPCSPHSGDCNTGMTTPANNQTPVEPLDTQPTTERGFL